ncbi:hypothetical protein GCM10023165_52260 [Variovorax defluvii]|uniref:Uncharacterized protein n=1 Tax=Variovorax defluvii TaxID=913761 RepID=A0ABP8IFJ9_9BURK
MNFDTRERELEARERTREFDARRDDQALARRRPTAPEAPADIAPDDLQRLPEHPVQRAPQPVASDVRGETQEALSSLFTPEMTRDFRASWDAVQISFVDDPEQAVRKADELVRQVLDDLGRTFSADRAGFREDGVDEAERTERLRMALRRYRAFLQRLLTL